MKITIGADPEVFVRKVGEPTYTSAHGMIPGTKEEPFKVYRGAVQVDGMALEFNIDPAETEEDFVTSVKQLMTTLEGMVGEEHIIEAVPTAKFSESVLEESPEEALELGCEPDYNAYTGHSNPMPEAEGLDYRTGGGHIHVGWTEGESTEDPEHQEACRMLAKQMDFYLGLGSILFDSDVDRRVLYGKAGCFRTKSYGMEYRTLSNAWLKDEKLVGWVYRTSIKAFNDLVDGKCAFNKLQNFAEGIINRSNNGPNTKAAILRLFNLLDIEDPTSL